MPFVSILRPSFNVLAFSRSYATTTTTNHPPLGGFAAWPTSLWGSSRWSRPESTWRTETAIRTVLARLHRRRHYRLALLRLAAREEQEQQLVMTARPRLAVARWTRLLPSRCVCLRTNMVSANMQQQLRIKTLQQCLQAAPVMLEESIGSLF